MLRRIAAASLASIAVAAFAQPSPSITIAFNSNSVVPVGGVGTIIAGVLLALSAAWLLRKRAAAARTMLGVAAVTGVLGALTHSGQSDAISVPTNLVTSPTVLNISGSGGFYSFVNATAGPIVITSITVQNGGPLTIDTMQTTCLVAVSLAPGATCTVAVLGQPA